MGAAGITLGLRLPVSGPFADDDAVIQVADNGEAAGFDTLWVHDHVSWQRDKLTHFATGSVEACRDQDPNFYESVTTLAFLAGRLRRARLGVASVVLPLRDPRVLAKQLTTIERLSGSRLTVVLGVGNIPDDFKVMGVRWDRRGRITNDYFAALRAILDSEQPVSFRSAEVSFTSGSFYPRPGRLPLWVAANSEAGNERAVRFADGWLTAYKTSAEYAASYRSLCDIAAARGRDVKELATSYETYVCVADTRDEAIAIARRSLEQPPFNGLERGTAVCIVGSPDDAIRRVKEYRDAGAGHLEMKLLAHDLPQLHAMVERIGRTVLPEFGRGA